MKNDAIFGVINEDLRLSFQFGYDKLFNLNGVTSHYFITFADGTILMHSNVTIDSSDATIVMAEFSPTNVTLPSDPETPESKYFSKNIYPKIVNVNATELYEFTRFGSQSLIGIAPINIHNITPYANGDYIKKTFVINLVINEQEFILNVTDKSEIIKNIVIWILIFSAIFLLLLIIQWYFGFKIFSCLLGPIKRLNIRVSTLMKTGGDLKLDTGINSLSSYESRKLYEVFNQLNTTRKFTNDEIFLNHDVITIMEYAEAHTVFADNPKAQGIWLTNIGHIYFKNQDYLKAKNNYANAAEWALRLMQTEDDQFDQNKIQYLYWKRKYYEVVWQFYHAKLTFKEDREDVSQTIESNIQIVKDLYKTKMSSVNDILIMLYLHSSNWLTLNRKLISAEKDLDYAIRIIKTPYKIKQSKRPDIPIIPKSILKQRIILQKALILIEYSKAKQAAILLTSLLKIGRIYDPSVRKEALKLLI